MRRILFSRKRGRAIWPSVTAKEIFAPLQLEKCANFYSKSARKKGKKIKRAFITPIYLPSKSCSFPGKDYNSPSCATTRHRCGVIAVAVTEKEMVRSGSRRCWSSISSPSKKNDPTIGKWLSRIVAL